MISIIVPVYNNEKFIKETIKSIRSQSYKDWELIIINDASTDYSKNIILKEMKKDKRIDLINLKYNQGVSNARNIGLLKAKGDYISFLDGDDIWDNRFLEILYHKITLYQLDFVYSSYKYLCEDNKIRERNVEGNDGFYDVFISNKKSRNEIILPFNIGSILIRKEIIDKYKIKFPHKLSVFEDMFFILKILAITKAVKAGDGLQYYRQHNESCTHKKWGYREYVQEILYLNLIKKYTKKNNSQLVYCLDTVITYRTYRIIWLIIKDGDIENALYLIKKWKTILKKFLEGDYKFNNKLKCKIFLTENKVLLRLLRYL